MEDRDYRIYIGPGEDVKDMSFTRKCLQEILRTASEMKLWYGRYPDKAIFYGEASHVYRNMIKNGFTIGMTMIETGDMSVDGTITLEYLEGVKLKTDTGSRPDIKSLDGMIVPGIVNSYPARAYVNTSFVMERTVDPSVTINLFKIY
jgi:hypothetical protein